MQGVVRTNVSFVSIVFALTACHYASDIPALQPADAAPQDAGVPIANAVQITGIDRMHQTATVVTVSCAWNKYETDRRDSSRMAIRNALNQQAASLPGGVKIDVQSMSVRVRCHEAGVGGFAPYCVSDATLTLKATMRDQRGQSIDIQVSKEASERADKVFICTTAMPAVTASVDKALAVALADIQQAFPATISAPR